MNCVKIFIFISLMSIDCQMNYSSNQWDKSSIKLHKRPKDMISIFINGRKENSKENITSLTCSKHTYSKHYSTTVITTNK